MTNATVTTAPDLHWKTYLKAVVFLAPPLLTWAVLTVFVAPKIKQLCADANAGPFTLFTVMDFVQDYWLLLMCGAVGLLLLLEWRLPVWRSYRRAWLGTFVFLLNSVVILGMANLLIIAAIAGPQIINR